jgi:hypothetical protein
MDKKMWWYPVIAFIAVCLMGLFVAAAGGTQWGTKEAAEIAGATLALAGVLFLMVAAICGVKEV